MAQQYTCPCCGYLVFDEPPGSYEICPICYWEDDLLQLTHPKSGGGANNACLFEAQRSFAQHGWCEGRVAPYVRAPNDKDRRDPGWRPLDETRDRLGPPSAPASALREADLAVLYYWRVSIPPRGR